MMKIERGQGVGQRLRWSEDRFRGIEQAQRDSGLSVQEYCRRERINATSFYRWRARLASGRGGVRPGGALRSRTPASPFIPLTSLPMSGGLTLKFDLGGGIYLTVLR